MKGADGKNCLVSSSSLSCQKDFRCPIGLRQIGVDVESSPAEAVDKDRTTEFSFWHVLAPKT